MFPPNHWWTNEAPAERGENRPGQIVTVRLFSEIERISRLTKLVKKVGRLPVILGEVEDTQAGACTERGGEDLIGVGIGVVEGIIGKVDFLKLV